MRDGNTLMGLLMGDEGDPNDRTQALGQIVLDLLMEVEALRRTVIALSAKVDDVDDGDDALRGTRHGLPRPLSVYADAYVSTAWLTHNAAGPSSGWEKLFCEFYSNGKGDDSFRERVMLKRLGFSAVDIKKYVDDASAAETRT